MQFLMNMRIIYIATGDIALPSFRRLLAEGRVPEALVTQPDKPVGRHQVLTAPLIKIAALEAGVPVYQPENISGIADELAALAPDLMVVMAYGQILRKEVLTLPRLAIINLHASLLPRHRGAACIQAAIDAGDTHTGITAMHMISKLDAGDTILKKSIPIAPDETGGSLHERLAEIAPNVLMEALDLLEVGNACRTPQDPSEVTYIPKLERDDGRLDWSMSASDLERRIRAYDPWPGTFTHAMEDGTARRLKIFPPSVVLSEFGDPGIIRTAEGELIVGCGEKSLKISTVQPEGGRRMKASDYLRGRKPGRFE